MSGTVLGLRNTAVDKGGMFSASWSSQGSEAGF